MYLGREAEEKIDLTDSSYNLSSDLERGITGGHYSVQMSVIRYIQMSVVDKMCLRLFG